MLKNNPNESPLQPVQAESPESAKLQLKVVLDTNVLHTDSASDLVRQELSTLLTASIYPDLEIAWYLPDVVRHERQYQMQRKAVELYASVKRIERLLGYRLNTTRETLRGRVEELAEQDRKRLGFHELRLDTSVVDWHRMIADALYRKPPFQEGETEKGFRDALIVESFLQLVSTSPKAPDMCRLVLITSDKLLGSTVRSRLPDSSNAAVYASLEQLKGLINTLIADVDEGFIARLRPKAEALFWVSGDSRDGIYYSENVRNLLFERFEDDMTSVPDELTYRKNGQWWINEPQFVRKEMERMVWATRLDVEASAIKLDVEHWQDAIDPAASPVKNTTIGDLMRSLSAGDFPRFPYMKKTVTHKGTDSYEVVWSTIVTISEELEMPVIKEIKHVGVNWEAVTS